MEHFNVESLTKPLSMKPNLDKIRKLAAHIRTVLPENFNFGFVRCGSVGCAMGHAPDVFPKEVKLGEPYMCDGQPRQDLEGVTEEWCDYEECAEGIFEIDWDTSSGLFNPNSQQDVHPSLPNLGREASAVQVADMLELFCLLVEQGKLPQFENPRP